MSEIICKYKDEDFAKKMMNGEVPKDQTINQEGYKERPELDYTQHHQYITNLELFRKHKNRLIYPPSEAIYRLIRDRCIDHVKNHPQYPKFNWKPKIADIGCGGGFGSYVLSHEADFVWGVDADPESIAFAKACFEKNKNGIYYSSQLSFDVIDINDEPREIMPFDIVVCVEIIEHIYNYLNLINFTKRLCKKDKKGNYVDLPDATEVYFSSPNRNYFKISKEIPKNRKHVREWSPDELYGILIKHFKYVELTDNLGVPQDLDTQTSVLLFKCEVPII